MKNVKIQIDNKEYPARETMGAMYRFKKETGREATTIRTDGVTDISIYLWCCVASACAHDKVDFPYTLEEFLDAATEEVVLAWADSIAKLNDSDSKKKPVTESPSR